MELVVSRESTQQQKAGVGGARARRRSAGGGHGGREGGGPHRTVGNQLASGVGLREIFPVSWSTDAPPAPARRPTTLHRRPANSSPPPPPPRPRSRNVPRGTAESAPPAAGQPSPARCAPLTRDLTDNAETTLAQETIVKRLLASVSVDVSVSPHDASSPSCRTTLPLSTVWLMRRCCWVSRVASTAHL